MAKRSKRKDLLTASDLARFCQVDLKTIHNWCEREEIAHFRTPGRHLRFRREDALDFLKRYGYPIPEELEAGRRRVLLLGSDSQMLGSLRVALTDAFDVTVHTDAVDAMLSVGSAEPDAIVVSDDAGGVDGLHVLARLNERKGPRRAALLFAGAGARHELARAAGAGACVSLTDPAAVREAIGRLCA